MGKKSLLNIPRAMSILLISVISIISVISVSGCVWDDDVEVPAPDEPINLTAALPAQQVEAYPDAASGLFISLVDFEDAYLGLSGYKQVEQFKIVPLGKNGRKKFVVNITSTGAGAMEVILPKGSDIVYYPARFHDFSGYELLLLAIYSDSVRDDLSVTLVSSKGKWTSPRQLVGRGWNNVAIDIQRFNAANTRENAGKNFDITDVREIVIHLDNPAGDLRFHIDDILLIKNDRLSKPIPAGMNLRRKGTKLLLALPGESVSREFSQSLDGLWRFGRSQSKVSLAGADRVFLKEGASLGVLGASAIGKIEVLEHNAIRVRISNTWYFTSRRGEWSQWGVRYIRWLYTFYADGRRVTHVELNNSGGDEITKVAFSLPEKAVWASGLIASEMMVDDFTGPIGRWSYQLAGGNPLADFQQNCYLRPGSILKGNESALPAADGGDGGNGGNIKDGYDHRQGCYVVSSKGNSKGCGFTLVPPANGVMNPVVLVRGMKNSAIPSINVEGMMIRHRVLLSDGAVLFVIPGKCDKPTEVEIICEK